MYYFRFEIPQGLDYSPGWHGTMDRDPNGVQVLLYNDQEGYGLATAEDDFVPPEVTVVGEEWVNGCISEAIQKLTADLNTFKPIFLSGKYLPHDPEFALSTVENRFSDAVKAKVELSTEITPVDGKTVIDTLPKFCPICHQLTAYIVYYQDGSVTIVQNGKTLVNGITCKTINLKCSAGHTVEVTCG